MGRHLDPVGDGSAPSEPAGAARRLVDARPQTAPDAVLNPHLRDPDADLRGGSVPRTPGEDALAASRQSWSERRREGLLPQSEDPLRRRPVDRPSGPPPGGGRRRSDAEPMSAARDTDRPPAPRSALPVSGPMTSVTSAASTVPPRASTAGRPVPPRVAPAPGPADRSGAGSTPPRAAGVSSWPVEATGPAPSGLDVTQRVSGSAPAGSAWGARVDAAPTMAPRSAPPRTPQTPPRAVAERPAPATAPPARPAVDRPAVDRPETGRPRRERRDDDRFSADRAPADPDPAEQTMLASGAARRAVDVPVGGRAAARLERQAVEAAARKSNGRRTAPPAPPAGGRDDTAEAAPRAPRRAVQGLLAVVVIALVVLGVWSFNAPGTSEIAATTPVPSEAPVSAPLAPPALPSLAPVVPSAPAPVAPVKAPITVLNSTGITGLAATIGEQFTAGGWEVVGTGPYPGDDIAATTVFFTTGDVAQEQAATQLVEQFGADVTGPVARFFEVEGVADPGIVVVATGNWRP